MSIQTNGAAPSVTPSRRSYAEAPRSTALAPHVEAVAGLLRHWRQQQAAEGDGHRQLEQLLDGAVAPPAQGAGGADGPDRPDRWGENWVRLCAELNEVTGYSGLELEGRAPILALQGKGFIPAPDLIVLHCAEPPSEGVDFFLRAEVWWQARHWTMEVVDVGSGTRTVQLLPSGPDGSR